MSLIVASGVDFFVGIRAVVVEAVLGVALGVVLVAAGEEDLLGEAEASVLGAGEAVFSVVTDTVGSELVSGFSEAVASGDGLSSWARTNGVAAANSTVMAAIRVFIWFSG